MQEAGLPPGALSVLPMTRETGDLLVKDDRYRLLTFTGSAEVGWAMKARAGRKKVVLELGGNAAVIVDEGSDVPVAAERVATGGFSYAGQSCISIQRILVHEDVAEAFTERLVANVEELAVGDPLDPDTDVGPLITPEDRDRAKQWVDEAVRAGAELLTGREAVGDGRRLPPTPASPPR